MAATSSKSLRRRCKGWARRLAGLSCALQVFVGWSAPLRADEPRPASAGPLYITLGANAVYGPTFDGSKRSDVGPWPIISWRNAADKQWLDLPTDGIDFALIETEKFRAGPVGYVRWQRGNELGTARGYSRFGQGNSAIDVSLEAGLFAEFWPVEWLRTRIEAREAVVGANGLIGILSSDLVWRPDGAWTLSAGPRLTLADRAFMESYYGVTAAQALASSVQAYAPSAGIRSYGGGAMARYKHSDSWTTQAFADYQHLTGPAGNSPLVRQHGSTEQLLLGVGASYTFRAPW